MPTGAIAEINLMALRCNYRLLAGKVAPETCAAVVKANAYGLGMIPVASALYDEGCRHFFVASIAEGIDLREAFPTVHIGIFYGVATRDDAQLAITHNLLPSLNSVEQIALWQKMAREQGKLLSACLHVDTGMSRLGISLPELQQLAENPDKLEGIDVHWLMSHLACADAPEHALNLLQLKRFTAARAIFPNLATSFANSSGIFLGQGYHGNLARPGAALYGINPTPSMPNPMQTVVAIKAPILQVRTLSQPETVGYGATYCAPANARLATVACGYADGLMRAMSGHAYAYVAGVHVPLAGTISMDVAVIDMTNLPEQAVKTGDMVEFIGPNISVDDAASQAGTIGYEIFTSMGERMQRVYYEGN